MGDEKKSDSNFKGAIAYLLGCISGVVLYLVEKEDKYVRFHAVQSTILFGGLFILNIVLMVTLVGILLMPIVGLIALALWVFLMYKAYNGEKYKLPYIGDMAEKYV